MYNREKIIKIMNEINKESKRIKPYVIFAQPRRMYDEIPAQNLGGKKNNDKNEQVGIHVNVDGFSYGFCDVYGEKVDVARNYLIDQVLESGAKYLMFVGEDTVIPHDGFKKLHKTAQENPNSVVVGVYYVKISDPMIMINKDDHIIVPNVDPGQIIEAWQTGMDSMLIPVEILQRMKKEDPDLPFCCIGSGLMDEENQPIDFIGEDNFFVYRLRKMGVKLLVDTDVQCLHVDLASGKYTAHPDVDLNNYFTNFPITERLTLKDKREIDQRWISRIPKGSTEKSEA